MTQPLITVIIPVYDCRAVLGETLDSVFGQSLPAGRIEVIAVDDGSTDGSAELLDELARVHDRLVVVHQPNSGGPGAPRNRGLERASGEFVFFLDADDRLGPEALERMAAMAERNGTDIVLGKYVGVGGRRVPQVFERTIERTHVLDPDCDLFPRMSMAALQLFRRSLVERAGLRFTEGLLAHEDHLFTTGAYLQAGGLSVLADYDCYYWTARADESSSTQLGGAATVDVHAITDQAMRLVAEHTEPGEIRERLHYRFLQLEVFGRLERLSPDPSDDEERKVVVAGGRELLGTWLTPGLLRRYSPLRRAIAHCLRHGLDDEMAELLRFHRSGERPGVLLEDGRAFHRLPLFRDAAAAIPDSCFESFAPLGVRPELAGVTWEDDALVIRGTVVLRDVDEGFPSVRLVMEDEDGGAHHVECATVPAPRTGEGCATAFTATLDPVSESWPDGRRTMSLEVAVEGHTRTVPLVKRKDVVLPRAVLTRAAGRRRLVRPLPERGRGTLVLEAGGGLGAADFRNVEVAKGPGRLLRVTGEPPPVLPSGAPPPMSVLLRLDGGDGEVVRALLEEDPDAPSRRYADLPLASARRGRWQAYLEIDGLGEPAPVCLPAGTRAFGPITTSVLPPRRVHVRLGKSAVNVHVTVPLTGGLRRARRLLGRSGTAPILESRTTSNTTSPTTGEGGR
jgi:hypothetical protein